MNTPVSKMQLNGMRSWLVKGPKPRLLFLPQDYSQKWFLNLADWSRTQNRLCQMYQASFVIHLNAEVKQARILQRTNIVSKGERALHPREMHSEQGQRQKDDQMTEKKLSELQQHKRQP